jgi:hypothetical protein
MQSYCFILKGSDDRSVIEASSFYGTQQGRCLPPHLKTDTDPVSETLRFLVSRIPDDGQSYCCEETENSTDDSYATDKDNVT